MGELEYVLAGMVFYLALYVLFVEWVIRRKSREGVGCDRCKQSFSTIEEFTEHLTFRCW